ncbi:HEPN domain-containing protein [uncultured Thiodictyon sp.]|jgi:HEPN domain-containing protein|uniref:HEPN domain-containing protein n=1 Tax=uncultured Thiodictyon sp. TaxID=1846217 RepID=UPI0025EA66A2|nr:HEPN domain-containing protein [uncultured Thiodictyon sp.]
MNPCLEEAERLLRLARRDRLACATLIALPELASSVACFHAQQAAEKALKALMTLHGVEFRRTHDLEELAARLEHAGQTLPVSEPDLIRLTPYAVEFRYNDDAMPLIDPADALSLADTLIAWCDTQIKTRRPSE